VDLDRLLTAFIGAFLGAAGWLVVGIYLSRRQHHLQARNAARAVYFEISMNAVDVEVARQAAVFQPLRRGSFDRLLPELATWLGADELQSITRAYMSQAGYDQAQRDTQLPAPVRQALLDRVLAEHRHAAQVLLRRAFSQSEAARLSRSSAEAYQPAAVSGRAGTALDA
jgi:hypothetical protein